IGEIDLARLVRPKPADRGAEPREVHRVRPEVRFGQTALLRSGEPRLDDARHVTGRVAYNAAVRVVGPDLAGEDGERRASRLEERPAGKRMQNLRDLRFHPCRKPSREHDRQRRVLHPAGASGWGARIRTWDSGSKVRCLTTWPRPTGHGSRILARAIAWRAAFLA